MNIYHSRIVNFVSELEQLIDVVSCEQGTNFYLIQTSKYYIYIYLSGASRVIKVRELGMIHIDIDQILTIPSKLLARLKGLHNAGQRIYGRQTVVARIDKKTALAFQEEHHIQAALPGKYRYGLYFQGDLVSIAIFSGGRHMRDQAKEYRSFELLRFCHKADNLIIGGLSKLIKAFVADFKPQDIMTYADLDWTQDSSLHTIGFETVGQIAPQKYYIVNGIRQFVLPDENDSFYQIQNLGSLKLKLII